MTGRKQCSRTLFLKSAVENTTWISFENEELAGRKNRKPQIFVFAPEPRSVHSRAHNESEKKIEPEQRKKSNRLRNTTLKMKAKKQKVSMRRKKQPTRFASHHTNESLRVAHRSKIVGVLHPPHRLLHRPQ